MISDEKQFEFVSAQISFFGQRQLDVFKLFLQLFSAIVGGSIWISLNKEILDANKAKLAWLSIISVWLILLIVSDLQEKISVPGMATEKLQRDWTMTIPIRSTEFRRPGGGQE